MAAPTLAELDGVDADLEIIAPSGDRHIYAFNPDGSAVPGWPVFLRDEARLDAGDSIRAVTHRVVDNDGADNENSGQIVVSVATGDINGDGQIDVLAAANEQYVETPNTDEPLPTDYWRSSLATGTTGSMRFTRTGRYTVAAQVRRRADIRTSTRTFPVGRSRSRRWRSTCSPSSVRGRTARL